MGRLSPVTETSASVPLRPTLSSPSLGSRVRRDSIDRNHDSPQRSLPFRDAQDFLPVPKTSISAWHLPLPFLTPTSSVVVQTQQDQGGLRRVVILGAVVAVVQIGAIALLLAAVVLGIQQWKRDALDLAILDLDENGMIPVGNEYDDKLEEKRGDGFGITKISEESVSQPHKSQDEPPECPSLEKLWATRAGQDPSDLQMLPFAWIWGVAAQQDPSSCNVTVYLTTYTHGVLALQFPHGTRGHDSEAGAALPSALMVTRGSGWERVTGPGLRSQVRVERVRERDTPSLPLPLLLSWAHTNLLRAIRRDPEEETQFEDNIFKRQLAGCRGVALAPGWGGVMYVAAKDGHAIWQVDTVTGRAAVLTGGNGIGLQNGLPAEARFAFPSGLAISPDGAVLYVADFLNDCIRQVLIARASSDARPGGDLATAGQFMGLGRTARRAQQLCRMGVTGCSRASTLAGGARGFSDGPFEQARFNGPRDVAVADGRIFVIEAGYVKRRASYHASGWWDMGGLGTWTVGGLNGDNGQRVRVLDLDSGMVSTLAGSSTPGFHAGVGAAAKFRTPLSIVLVPADTHTDNQTDYRLMVADGGNKCVRSVNVTSGEVSCVAGDPCEHRATTSLDNNTETWAARHPAQNQSTMHADSAGRVRFSGDMRGMAVVAGTSHGARVENNKFLLVADRHAYALQVINIETGKGSTIAKAVRVPPRAFRHNNGSRGWGHSSNSKGVRISGLSMSRRRRAYPAQDYGRSQQGLKYR